MQYCDVFELTLRASPEIKWLQPTLGVVGWCDGAGQPSVLLLIWLIVCAGGSCLDIFSLVYYFSLFSP